MATVIQKPRKPYADFPLFPHASGQWAKKIRGRTHYFGVWAEPDVALQKYLAERDFLQAGLEPPADSSAFTLRDLCNEYLTSKNSRLNCGELAPQTFADYKRTCELLLDTFGRDRAAESIGPRDFTRLRAVITATNGPVRTKNVVTQIRMIFRFGEQQELIAKPRFGSEFVRPSKKTLQTHRQASPMRMFEADEIRALLGEATANTKAWILLGINGAFIQKDVSDLPLSAVCLKTGFVDFPRQKTATERRISLWPETIKALQASLRLRQPPVDSADADAFFITSCGHRLVCFHRERGTRTDAVHTALERIQRKLKIKQTKRSFGALRHTFRTIADETCDLPAIMRIMGQADNTISNYCRERIKDTRLRTVTEHVRTWLLGNEAN